MTERIIIAGAGGQGVMLLGKIVAEAAMRDNKYVTWFPSYGPEVRGGAAYCMIVISDEEINSPYVEKADTLIIMNGCSLERFKLRIKSKGLILMNSSLVHSTIGHHAHILKFPFTDIAIELGNVRVANMVALGCYIGRKKIIDTRKVLNTIEDFAPQDKKHLVEINTRAVAAGIDLIKNKNRCDTD